MPAPFSQQQVRVRTALLVFMKGVSSPLVLYFERPEDVYAELKELIRTGVSKVIEKETIGPIRKITLMSNEICAVALQDEQFI